MLNRMFIKAIEDQFKDTRGILKKDDRHVHHDEASVNSVHHEGADD